MTELERNMKLDEYVHSYASKNKKPKPRNKSKKVPSSTRINNTGTGAENMEAFRVTNVAGESNNTGAASSFDDIAGDQYQQLIDAQKAQLEAAYNKQAGDYSSQRQQSASDYRSLINQATAENAMQERARRESMANMGLSGAGGTSRTHAQMANNNLVNQLGSIKLQQKEYNEEVDRALADLAGQYNSDSQNVSASIGAQRLNDQLAYEQWKRGHELQSDQFEWSIENAKLNQLIDLLRSKKISKKQFETLSGIRL